MAIDNIIATILPVIEMSAWGHNPPVLIAAKSVRCCSDNGLSIRAPKPAT